MTEKTSSIRTSQYGSAEGKSKAEQEAESKEIVERSKLEEVIKNRIVEMVHNAKSLKGYKETIYGVRYQIIEIDEKTKIYFRMDYDCECSIYYENILVISWKTLHCSDF